MKVCLVLDNIDKNGGGPSRSVPVLAKGLALCGIDVTILALKSDDMNTHLLDGTGVKFIAVENSICKADLEKIVLDGQYDLLHQQGMWMPIYHRISVIARKLGIPYIMTPRGCLEPWCYEQEVFAKRIKKQFAMLLYQRKDLKKASCILTTADMEAENLRHLGFTNPLPVIPNGIEIDDYQSRGDESKVNIKKRAIFLSRIVGKKGVDILIDAWVSVKENHPEWNLIIVGNGEPEYIDQLNRRIHANGLDGYVQIEKPAFGIEKYKLYTESSLFVLPTHSENFGMVVAEALSCGLPVITTTGAPWHILEETNTGWWIELSQKNLEEALEKAMNLPANVLYEMGQRGSEMVRSNFHYVEVAKKNVEMYRWVIEGGKAPEFMYRG